MTEDVTHINPGPKRAPSDEILLGEITKQDEISLQKKTRDLRVEEKSKHVDLTMKLGRFAIAGVLTLGAIIVGLVIYFSTDDPNDKTWALSLMQSVFLAGMGYSFGTANPSSAPQRADERTSAD